MSSKRKLARIAAAAAVTAIYSAAAVKAYNDKNPARELTLDDAKKVVVTAAAMTALTWVAALL